MSQPFLTGGVGQGARSSMERTRFFRRPFVWIVLVILGVVLIATMFSGGSDYTESETSVAMAQFNQSGQIEKAVLKDKEQVLQLDLQTPITVEGKQTDKIQAYVPADAIDEIYPKIEALGAYNVEVTEESIWVAFLINLLPIVIIVVLLLLFMSQMQGGGSRVLNFGKSKAKLVSKDTPKTAFADVAGADEAVEELEEIKDFLQDPSKYQALGAKIPKGGLLFGEPGTGKTLLARAG